MGGSAKGLREPFIYKWRVDKEIRGSPCLQWDGRQRDWEVPSFTMGVSAEGFGEPLIYNVRVDKVAGRLHCLQCEGQQSYWEALSLK